MSNTYDTIKQAVARLSDSERAAYLSLMLRHVAELKIESKEERASSEVELPSTGSAATVSNAYAPAIEALIELYEQLLQYDANSRQARWLPSSDTTHVHIVVGDSFAGGMKQALNKLGRDSTHKLIVLREDYSIGPLGGLDAEGGRKRRSEWFREHISEAYEIYADAQLEQEYEELLHAVSRIPEDAEIVLWAGDNALEQVGIRHAAHLLRGKHNAVSLHDPCTMCERLFNRPDAVMIYRYSGEITPEKLTVALKEADNDVNGRLDEADRSRMEQEWQAIAEQSHSLRIWDDSAQIREAAPDYFDTFLLDMLDRLLPPGDDRFLKAARVIGEALGHSDQYVGDSYLEYRLRELAYDGVLEMKGVPAAMRFYSVRRKRQGSRL